MPRQSTEPFEDQVLQKLEDQTEDVINRLAQQAGPPPDAEKLSEADEDEAWAFTDPSVDYDDLAARIMTQGIPPQEANRFIITKLKPDWLPLYGMPTQDAEMAHQLARLAQMPFRASILEDIDDPDEQVKKAEQMDRRYQKRLTAAQEQMAAMPTPTTQGYGGMTREGAA